MKLINRTLLFVSVLFFLASCSNAPKGDKAPTQDVEEVKETPTTAAVYTLNAAESKMNWEGSKPGGTHTGTISMKSGSLEVLADNITGGSFEIDMNSINNGDLTDATKKAKLENHLKSPDFFDVAQYPTSKFEITKIVGYSGQDEATHMIYGNLTLKGVSKNISFKAKVSLANGALEATSLPFTINRAEWNVKYGSKSFFDNLKDNFINDEIGLSITLKASAS